MKKKTEAEKRKLTDTDNVQMDGGATGGFANTPHRIAHRPHPANSPRIRSDGGGGQDRVYLSVYQSIPFFDVFLHDGGLFPPRVVACCVFLASLLLRRRGGGVSRT